MYKENGGAFMFTALCGSLGAITFLEFLKSAVFLTGYISTNNLFPEPLSPEEEKEYLEQMKNGDEEARNILIERNLRLVAHICKKYCNLYKARTFSVKRCNRPTYIQDLCRNMYFGKNFILKLVAKYLQKCTCVLK